MEGRQSLLKSVFCSTPNEHRGVIPVGNRLEMFSNPRAAMGAIFFVPVHVSFKRGAQMAEIWRNEKSLSFFDAPVCIFESIPPGFAAVWEKVENSASLLSG